MQQRYRAVILNGERPTAPLTTIESAVAAALTEAGAHVETYRIHEQHIKHCVGCFGCWVESPGECVIADDNRDVAAAAYQSDLMVFLTPVTFGGYSAELKRMVDHLIPLILPFFRKVNGEIHHRPRYDRYPDILGVGVLGAPQPAQEATFRRLVAGNAVNMNGRGASAVLYTGDDPYTWQQAVSQALAHILEVA